MIGWTRPEYWVVRSALLSTVNHPVNYSSLILLMSASLCRANLEQRGKRIRPRNTAVRVHRELVEDA